MDKMISPNSATMQDRIENYVAGHELMKKLGSKAKAEVGETVSTRVLQYFRGRRQHFAHNPIVPNMADYVNWILWDRLVTAAGGAIPTTFALYTIPIGQGGKTKVDTNLDLVSQLPQPYWINCTHLGFYWEPNTLMLDVVNLLHQSYMEFWVNNKIYLEGPLQCFQGGAGAYGSTAQTGGTINTNGVPQGNSMMFDLRLPAGLDLGNITSDGLTGITILQSQLFKVVINLPGGALTLTANNATPTVGVGLTLYSFLHGHLSRSVA